MKTYRERFAQLSRHRQEHSLRVAAVMEELAVLHGLPADQAFLAGYAHDLAREMSRDALLAEALRLGVRVGGPERQEPVLLHGPVAAAWLEEEGVGAPEVHQAIRYHTTAAPGQDATGQALFIADGVEPGRQYPRRAAIEETARHSLAKAYRALLEETLDYLKGRGLTPHPLMLQALRDTQGEKKYEEECVIPETSRQWAELAARTAEQKKGENVVVLDMREVTLVADYFVILSGHTTIQVAALAEHIEEALKDAGVPLLHKVGGSKSHWVLLDYGALVVHVFTEEERQYYDLERLWGDADIVQFS